jgi:hypothetical protein
MRDEEYFNDTLFVYSNKELKKLIIDYLKKSKSKKDFQTPLYIFVDDAIKVHLKSKGINFDKKPRKLALTR